MMLQIINKIKSKIKEMLQKREKEIMFNIKDKIVLIVLIIIMGLINKTITILIIII